MEHGTNYLQSAVVFLLAAVFMVPLAKRLQLGAVLGYLLAGVIIGPYLLGLIDNPESVASLSELGVVLLLFIIGLELSPKRLWVMRKQVFGVGLAQVLLTGLAIGSVAALVFDMPVNTSVVLGGGLALSSTAFGLQILAERKELNSPYGRLGFAILLFQDIAAIPLIAMIPLLGARADSAAPGGDLAHVMEVVGSIAVVVIGGRFLLRPVFRSVARTGQADLSTATALLVVVGTAWLMEWAGVSMGLGRLPRRPAAGGLGIPPRTGSADRTLQGPAARLVLHQRGHECRPRPAQERASRGARPDPAAGGHQAAAAVPHRPAGWRARQGLGDPPGRAAGRRR